MDDICMYVMIGMCVLCAFLGSLYFWFEHNAKNDLSLKQNPLKVKWVIGGILGGLTVAGFMLYRLVNMEVDVNAMICTYGLVAGLLSILVAKVYNEGIGAFAKWMKQKAVDVVEAKEDISALIAFMNAQKAEIEQMKEKLNMP